MKDKKNTIKGASIKSDGGIYIKNLKHLSFSTLFSSLDGCLYRFYRQKLADDKLKFVPTSAMRRGTKMHSILEEAIKMNTATNVVDKKILIEKNKQFGAALDGPLLKSQVIELADYVLSENIQGACEKRIIWNHRGFKVWAILDLLVGDPKKKDYSVVDFKTMSKNDPPLYNHYIQLLIYHLSLMKDSGFEIDDFDDNYEFKSAIRKIIVRSKGLEFETVPLNFTKDSLAFIEEEFDSRIDFVKMLADNNKYIKSRGWQCKNCELYGECNPFIT